MTYDPETDPKLYTFHAVQRIAHDTYPELTGDQLDRVGNIVNDVVMGNLGHVKAEMIMEAVQRVKTTTMEK